MGFYIWPSAPILIGVRPNIEAHPTNSSVHIRIFMPVRKIFDMLSTDLAIDLGTSNTLIYVKNKGIVIFEPSVVAVEQTKRGEKRVVAVGKEAKEMLGRTPEGISAVKPLRDAVIADFELTEAMLRYFIKKSHTGKAFIRPRIIIGTPSDITEVERRAVQESVESAGARETYIISEAMAAAFGAGLPVMEPSGNMLVDIGGGATEVAIISLGGIVASKSIRVAGNKMDEAITQYIRKKHGLLIGENTAEEIKIQIGSCIYLNRDEMHMEIKGRDLIGSVPRTLDVTTNEIVDALKEPIRQIIDVIKTVLERTPPELSADIVDRGIMLTGGGALLRNIDKAIHEITGLPVMVAEDPLTCVVLGAGKVLDNPELLEAVALPT
jgi:rod shape-determining protein MreB